MISTSLTDIISVVEKSWDKQDFDHLAYAHIDFNKEKVNSFECKLGTVSKSSDICFDLASLTKPLTLAAYFHLNPDKLTKNNKLLLNHRAGLPAWGRLGRDNWKEQLLSYELADLGKTTYSDFSALRLMLEIEKNELSDMRALCSTYWDKGLMFWKDLDFSFDCPVTGWRSGQKISHVVNDDNCFQINDFCTHAGLFADIVALSKSLINLNKQTSFVSFMNQKSDHRFFHGWDTVTAQSSLSGSEPDNNVFGHLGFTGTSLWIDPKLQKGWVLLTNATKDYWFHRDELNKLRRKLGVLSWAM